MKLVIEIPDEVYDRLKTLNSHGMATGATMYILNGKQLPKGHGRLIDADRLKSMYSINQANFNTVVGIQKWIERAPTIIEADTPKRRKGTPLEENDSGYNCENWIP